MHFYEKYSFAYNSWTKCSGASKLWPTCVVLNSLQCHKHFEIEICFLMLLNFDDMIWRKCKPKIYPSIFNDISTPIPLCQKCCNLISLLVCALLFLFFVFVMYLVFKLCFRNAKKVCYKFKKPAPWKIYKLLQRSRSLLWCASAKREQREWQKKWEDCLCISKYFSLFKRRASNLKKLDMFDSSLTNFWSKKFILITR